MKKECLFCKIEFEPRAKEYVCEKCRPAAIKWANEFPSPPPEKYQQEYGCEFNPHPLRDKE